MTAEWFSDAILFNSALVSDFLRNLRDKHLQMANKASSGKGNFPADTADARKLKSQT